MYDYTMSVLIKYAVKLSGIGLNRGMDVNSCP